MKEHPPPPPQELSQQSLHGWHHEHGPPSRHVRQPNQGSTPRSRKRKLEVDAVSIILGVFILGLVAWLLLTR